MKILWISENYYPRMGGMAQACDRIINNLRSHGFYIDLIHLSRNKKGISADYGSGGRDIRYALGESTSFSANEIYNDLIAENITYDCVVGFGGTYALHFAHIYSAWLKTHFIAMIRGNDFDEAVFDPRKYALLKEMFSRASEVLCVSQDKAERINLLLPECRAKCINNGIDLNHWTLSKFQQEASQKFRCEFNEDQILIGLVGHIKDKKGLGFFIKALERTGRTSEVTLILIGELLDEELTFLDELGINYRHIGSQSRFALMSYYPAMDALALPSFYDGMPNVMLEAGALAVPVIASKCGGMADLIKDQETGLLFNPGQLDECSELINTFLSMSINQRQQLGQNLKNEIYHNYTDAIETQKYVDVFLNLP